MWTMGKLEVLRRRPAEATQWLEKVLARDPGHQAAAVWLAFLQEESDQLDQAERTLQAARAHSASPIAALKLANFYYRHDALPQADQVLRDILRGDSKHAEAWNSLGTVLYRSGNPREAENCFTRAASFDRSLLDAHANLAALAAERGDLKRALTKYDVALALAPQNAQLYYARAVVLAEYGRPEDAQRSAQRALELDPQLERAQQLLEQLTAPKAK